jgi:uncharacterized protein YabN with tetrapyrrole methylase and pyrophosphatase domain
MTAQDTSIVEMYDSEGLSIEQIAEDTGYDVLAVKARLLQCSRKYRDEQTVKGAIQQDVTDEEYKELLMMYKNIARDTDVDPATRTRIIRDLMDEYKGRKEVKLQSGPQISINVINTEMQKIKDARQRTMGLLNNIEQKG